MIHRFVLINLPGIGEDKSLLWLEEDAESLRFGDNSIDSYTIAFGIRNVTHMEKALAEAYRYHIKPSSLHFDFRKSLGKLFSCNGKAKFW